MQRGPDYPYPPGTAYINAEDPLSPDMTVYFVCPLGEHWQPDALPLETALHFYPDLVCLDPDLHDIAEQVAWPLRPVPVTYQRLQALRRLFEGAA